MSCPEMSWTVWLSLCAGQTVTVSVSWQVAGSVELARSLPWSQHSSKAPYAGSLYRADEKLMTHNNKSRTRSSTGLEHSQSTVTPSSNQLPRIPNQLSQSNNIILVTNAYCLHDKNKSNNRKSNSVSTIMCTIAKNKRTNTNNVLT